MSPEQAPAAPDALPGWPAGWYAVARTRDMARGAVVTRDIGGRALVLFRTRGGAFGALDAHCPHMGAHLRHATVVGERLRCPLHHGAFDACGEGAGPACTGLRARPWPVAERYGLLLVHAGEGAPPPVPAPAVADGYAWSARRPLLLAADWRAMVVNSFDLMHFRAVHRRDFVEEPRLERLPEGGLLLSYVSRVTGRGPSDRAMRWLARDRIRVRLTCHGPTIVVETDLARTRTAAVLGLLPEGDRVRAFAAFGVPRREPLLPLRHAVARWLFSSFLGSDLAVIEGMRLTTAHVTDRGVSAVTRYLASLPEVGHG